MKKYILIILCLVSMSAMLKAQRKALEFSCNVSSKDFPTGLEASISVKSPDGLKTEIPADRETIIPLTKEGFYEIYCCFHSLEFGIDTISRKVLFRDDDVLGIKVKLHYGKESKFNSSDATSWGSLLIQRILKADPDIKLSYKQYSSERDYCGPIFTIENNSSNTLYGRYLPGYFWGEYAHIVDGEEGVFRAGTVDSCFVERDPLNPGESKEALIGSFGHHLPPGTYRFKLIYLTNHDYFDSSTLIQENDHHKWFYSMHDGYQISCDFVIKESDYNFSR